MNNRKYQVFISSTYTDLKEERNIILETLLKANFIPAGMEGFVATDMEQFEVIKSVIDLCDYYILILGKRYGSINEQTGKSYTEMEYDYAIENNIPVLVFAMDDSYPVSEDKIDRDESKIEALMQFKKRAMTNRLATIWKNHTDLAGSVAISIVNAEKDFPRPGWQRGVDYDEASLRRQIMEIQDEKDKILAELETAKKELDSLKNNNSDDIAFEDTPIEIEITHYHRHYNHLDTSDIIETSLEELFKIISTEMMDVKIVEMAVRDCILNGFNKSPIDYSFDNKQFVKILLNQYKALGLVYSEVDEKGGPYWGLTQKGEQLRNDLILIKKKD